MNYGRETASYIIKNDGQDRVGLEGVAMAHDLLLGQS